MQEEKSYSSTVKDFSYNEGMDSVRHFIVAHIAAHPEASLKGYSTAIGRNHAYLQQFVERGSPVELSERDRKALARAMKVPEDKLKHSERRIIPENELTAPHEPDDIPLVTDAQRPFPDALPQMVGRIGGGSTGAVITIDVGEMQSREEVGEWWRIPPAVLRGLARADVASTVGFPMDGDSMEPTIQRTDIVFVDTNRHKIEPDGIWAVDYGLGRTLKRVLVERVDGQTRYVLKSDNKAYPDQLFAPDEVTVFGRYVGRFSVF